MPRYKIKSPSGEIIYWDGEAKPSTTQIDAAFASRRAESHRKVQEAANSDVALSGGKKVSTDPGLLGRAVTSPVGQVAMDALETYFPAKGYHPIDSAKEAYSGLKQAFTGPNRTEGASRALEGAGGVLSVPALAVGAVTNPLATAAAFPAARLGGKLAQSGSEALGAKPDTSRLVGDVGALAAGAGVGAGVSKLSAPSGPQVLPPEGYRPNIKADWSGEPIPAIEAPRVPQRQLTTGPSQIENVQTPQIAPVEAPKQLTTEPKPPFIQQPGPTQRQIPTEGPIQTAQAPEAIAGANLPIVRPPAEVTKFQSPIEQASPVETVPEETPKVDVTFSPGERIEWNDRQKTGEYIGPGSSPGTSKVRDLDGSQAIVPTQSLQKFLDFDPKDKAWVADRFERMSRPSAGNTPEEIAEYFRDLGTPNELLPAKKQTLIDEQTPEQERLKSFYDTLDRIDESGGEDIHVGRAAEQAAQLGFSEEAFAESLRSSGLDEKQVDDALEKHYKPLREADQSTFHDFVSGKAKELLDSEEGSISVPTGIVSKGSAKLRNLLDSTDQVLESEPNTAPISKSGKLQYYRMNRFTNAALSEADKSTKDFSSSQLKDLRNLLEGELENPSPEVMRAGQHWRQILDSIYNMAISKGATQPSGKPFQYMSDYLTHVTKDDTFGSVAWDSMKHLFGEKPSNWKDRLFGEEEGFLHGAKDSPESRGKGAPQSPYTETRKGTDKLLETDPRRILRRYVESMSRMIFMKPWVQQSRIQIDRLPESPLKDASEWYVNNLAGLTDQKSGLGRVFRALDRKTANLGARSQLGLSPHLQAYHLMKLPNVIWPELGSRVTLSALGDFISSPRKVLGEATKAGLIQQDIIPSRFKGMGERLTDVVQLYDIGNRFSKAISLQGARKALRDKGDPNWYENAIPEAARIEGDVNPSQPNYLLESLPRNVAQYKFWSQKYGSAVARTMQKALMDKDPEQWKKLGRYLVGGALSYQIGKELGYDLFHFAGKNILDPRGTFITSMQKVGTDLSSGDFDKAGDELMKLVIPGGQYIGKELEN